MRLLQTILALALCLGSTACVANERPYGVVLASDPPGARILVDGKDTGFLTPTHLGLPRKRQRLDLELDGYQPASLLLAPGGKAYYLILWKEAYVTPRTWRFPLWLNHDDGLSPIRLAKGLQPRRIFVPLRLATQE